MRNGPVADRNGRKGESSFLGRFVGDVLAILAHACRHGKEQQDSTHEEADNGDILHAIFTLGLRIRWLVGARAVVARVVVARAVSVMTAVAAALVVMGVVHRRLRCRQMTASAIAGSVMTASTAMMTASTAMMTASTAVCAAAAALRHRAGSRGRPVVSSTEATGFFTIRKIFITTQ